RRRHTRFSRDWSSDVCSSDLDYYVEQGVDLGPLKPATSENAPPAGALVIAPPSAVDDRWSRRFADPLASFASGWMRIRQRAKQRSEERRVGEEGQTRRTAKHC